MSTELSLPQRFRRDTAAAHRQLDRLAILAPLRGIKLCPASYLRSLQALAAGHGALEAAVAQYPLDNPGCYRYRPRSQQLAADILALGGDSGAPPQSVFKLANEAECIGLLYVLEGSKLGSRYIHQLLTKQAPSLPRQFFAQCRDEQQDWQQFWALASSRLVHEGERQQAIDSAKRAFKRYIEQASALSLRLPA
ncbi:MAG: biliverdin-producing heme oxygenase [Cellvibrionaceae bacterium]|nr:biliverdin-producing heme oxygenase [Cellvibrionaceae bacterium]MCV6626837.1 biliverdin-producing heme oxygenase [Cellvibrionaceae bacterium]